MTFLLAFRRLRGQLSLNSNFCMQTGLRRVSGGFTLVELLVVVLIMSILLSVGATVIKGAGGKGVSTALAGTEAIFDEARSVAVGRATRARVLIDVDDPTDEAYYLKRVVGAYEEVDDEGKPTDSWKLSGRAYTLPDKVYFSQVYSTPDDSEVRLTGNGGNYDGDYAYFEFNAEGICTTGMQGGANYEAPRFVIGSGARPKGRAPRATGEGRRDFGGFVVWRNGSTSIFRDPSQFLGDSNPSEF